MLPRATEASTLVSKKAGVCQLLHPVGSRVFAAKIEVLSREVAVVPPAEKHGHFQRLGGGHGGAFSGVTVVHNVTRAMFL